MFSLTKIYLYRLSHIRSIYMIDVFWGILKAEDSRNNIFYVEKISTLVLCSCSIDDMRLPAKKALLSPQPIKLYNIPINRIIKPE